MEEILYNLKKELFKSMTENPEITKDGWIPLQIYKTFFTWLSHSRQIWNTS